jgi:hypothetical protein
MAFTSIDEIVIGGGSVEDRRRAAALILAADSIDDGAASREEGPELLALRFESVDDLPEEAIQALSPQFPSLSFTLVYCSLDGEFFGYAKAGPSGAASESEDFSEGTRDAIGRRYDGDVIAFVRATYSLPEV